MRERCGGAAAISARVPACARGFPASFGYTHHRLISTWGKYTGSFPAFFARPIWGRIVSRRFGGGRCKWTPPKRGAFLFVFTIVMDPACGDTAHVCPHAAAACLRRFFGTKMFTACAGIMGEGGAYGGERNHVCYCCSDQYRFCTSLYASFSER